MSQLSSVFTDHLPAGQRSKLRVKPGIDLTKDAVWASHMNAGGDGKGGGGGGDMGGGGKVGRLSSVYTDRLRPQNRPRLGPAVRADIVRAMDTVPTVARMTQTGGKPLRGLSSVYTDRIKPGNRPSMGGSLQPDIVRMSDLVPGAGRMPHPGPQNGVYGLRGLHGLGYQYTRDPNYIHGSAARTEASFREHSVYRRYGLGEVPESATAKFTVDQYMIGLNNVFGTKQGPDAPGNKWSFASHVALQGWIGRLMGVEDVSRFPAFGEDPGFMGFFLAGMSIGAFETSRAWDELKKLFEAIGVPTTDARTAIAFVGSRENAAAFRRLLDRVIRYVIGAEGGTAYGDPGTQTRGIVAGAAAVFGSALAIIAL